MTRSAPVFLRTLIRELPPATVSQSIPASTSPNAVYYDQDRKTKSDTFKCSYWGAVMNKIVNKIPSLEDAELIQMFKNAMRVLSKGENAQAELVKVAIEQEWKRRVERAQAGGPSWERPTKGMLHELGYHVGENGERREIRRRILKHVLEGELPLVSSIAYTLEWGSPGTKQRYWKLTRFLEGQIANRAYEYMEKAIIEWSEDLDWVREPYSGNMA